MNTTKHTCKLCSRRFPNGRALGGHMRSHVATATNRPRPKHHRHASPQPSSSSEPSTELPASYQLREKPKRSFKLPVDPDHRDPQFSSGNSSSVIVGDVTSDTSSVSDHATADEDVALCLMMLSRDVWPCTDKRKHEDEDEDYDDDGGGDEIVTVRSRSRYVCGTCKKVFRSYQALGGHRASHKRVRHNQQHGDENHEVDPREINDRVHQCPFCSRVFSSGQALGGHKRSHFTSAAPPARASHHAGHLNRGDSFIDLNLPAPVDELSDVSAAV